MNLKRLSLVLSCLLLSCSSPETSSGAHENGGTSGVGAGGASSAAGGATSSTAGSGGVSAIEVHVQDIRDGSIALETEVVLKGVFITAVSHVAGANYWVQEAQGVTTAGHEYPQYAGMQVFIDPLLAGTSFDVQRAKPGDCVDLIGTVGFVERVPERGGVDKFTPRDAAGCGTPPEPLVIDTDEAFAGIATDADPQTAGAQPGTNTNGLNGLLMAVPSVTATFVGSLSLSIPGVGMRVQRAGSQAMLVVFPPLASSPFALTQGQTVSVTGIFTNGAYLSSGSCGLAPRTVGDIVVSP